MPQPTLAGLGILIVEDEPLLRRQLAAHLERLGADATAAATLEAARAFIADLPFDFALLDVNLPDGQGTDLLKDKAFSANTNVIVMTADGAVAGAVEAMRLGALDYLVKPFDPAEVPLVIARARRLRQSARLEEHRRSDDAFSGAGFFFGSAMASLEKHWPGNVRELSHELERAIVFEEGGRLDFEHLQAAPERCEGTPADATDWLNSLFTFPPQGFWLEEAINRLIRLALKQTDNNVSAAARLLGVSRDYVRYRLAEDRSPETDNQS